MAYHAFTANLLDNTGQPISLYSGEVLIGNYLGSNTDFENAYHFHGDLFVFSDLFEPFVNPYTNTHVYTLSNGNHAIAKVHQDAAGTAYLNLTLYKPDWTVIKDFAGSRPDGVDYCVWYFIYDDTNMNFMGIGEVIRYNGYLYLTGSLAGSLDAATKTAVLTWIDGAEMTEDPYQLSPESDSEGGYGDFDYSGDTIGLPSLPSLSIADSGMVTLYKPTLAQLQSLASYLWAGLFDPATFKKIFADPMDCILSLAIAPVSPTATNQKELKVGNIGTDITIDVLDNQFVQVTYKTLNIGQRTKTFMDDSPYTKAQIYLPYIGVRGLAIDDIIRADLDLQYNIDLFTGACNASLKCTKKNKDKNRSQLEAVLYQFTGNVLANIPVTGQNFAAFIQATIGAVGTAVGVATGAGAVAGLASAVNAATSMKPDVEKSGNLSSTAGFLGVQKPYLILTYPHVCIPAGRDDVVGTPSFIGLTSSRKLSSFKGFTLLHKVNVKGLYCTDTERNMILQALTVEGVII